MNCGTRSVGRQFVLGYIAVPHSWILLEPFYGSSVGMSHQTVVYPHRVVTTLVTFSWHGQLMQKHFLMRNGLHQVGHLYPLIRDPRTKEAPPLDIGRRRQSGVPRNPRAAARPSGLDLVAEYRAHARRSSSRAKGGRALFAYTISRSNWQWRPPRPPPPFPPPDMLPRAAPG